eukprot:2572081-Pyramimonas_sp.AAC.1
MVEQAHPPAGIAGIAAHAKHVHVWFRPSGPRALRLCRQQVPESSGKYVVVWIGCVQMNAQLL